MPRSGVLRRLAHQGALAGLAAVPLLTRSFVTVAAVTLVCLAACGEQPTLGGGTGGGTATGGGTGGGTATRDGGPGNMVTDAGPNGPVDAGPKLDAGPTPALDAGPTLPKADAGVPDAGAACTMVHWYKDSDHDTYGDPAMVQDACAAPFGYVSSSTDCDDSNAARHPGAPELCNTVDDNCDGTVNGSITEAAGCEAAKGSFDGGFRLYTAEKVGSTVVNEMPCNGGESIKIDPAATPVVSGSVVCTYNGGLTAFDKTQRGTIAGTLGVDGKLSLVLDYGFSSASADRRQFKVTGTEAFGGLDGGGTGSWYPNQQSAVPWVVEISLSGVKR